MLGGIGIPLSLKGLKTNEVKLLAGEVYNIPAGHYYIIPGPYTFLQFLDPVSQLWRSCKQQTPNGPFHIESDGANYRMANLSGCPVGAVVTTAGSGYTSAPTVTPSAGGSVWKAIVGGLINATVTLPSFKGSNYTYPPIVIIDPPPLGGIQATATCAISAGAITAVTIRDQGAGYVTSPRMYFISDSRDPNNPVVFNPPSATPITPIGTLTYDFAGAQVGYVDGIATVTGSGTIAAVVCTDPGNVVTALPTLAFSGGGGSSGAATVVMNWSVTGFTVTGGGGGFSATFMMLIAGGNTAATPANTNPEIEQGITQIRQANVSGTASAGALSGTGNVIDGGLGYQAIPTGVPVGGLVTTAGTATITVGGQRDVVYLISDD